MHSDASSNVPRICQALKFGGGGMYCESIFSLPDCIAQRTFASEEEVVDAAGDVYTIRHLFDCPMARVEAASALPPNSIKTGRIPFATS